MIVAVAEHPCFADRTIARKRRGEQVGQATAAPEAILIDRIEPKRIQRYLIHALSSNSCLCKLVIACTLSTLLHRWGVFATASSLVAACAVIQGQLRRQHVTVLPPPNLQGGLLDGTRKRERHRPWQPRLESGIHRIQASRGQLRGLAA